MKNTSTNYMGAGIAIGIGVGVAIGVANGRFFLAEDILGVRS